MRFAGMLLLSVAVLAGDSLDRVLTELTAVRDFRETAISPDGARVAWVGEVKNKDGMPSRNSEIYVAAAQAGGKPRRITAGSGKGACMERGVSWSPDSSRIAFLSDCAKSGQLQLYMVSAAGG